MPVSHYNASACCHNFILHAPSNLDPEHSQLKKNLLRKIEKYVTWFDNYSLDVLAFAKLVIHGKGLRNTNSICNLIFKKKKEIISKISFQENIISTFVHLNYYRISSFGLKEEIYMYA